MKRKLLLTLALSTLFASSQLVFLPTVDAHATTRPHVWASSSASSSSSTTKSGNLEELLAKQKSWIFGNSRGLAGIEVLRKLLGE